MQNPRAVSEKEISSIIAIAAITPANVSFNPTSGASSRNTSPCPKASTVPPSTFPRTMETRFFAPADVGSDEFIAHAHIHREHSGIFVQRKQISRIERRLRWVLERKKWPGDVVRAFNTTRMLDRIAAKHGRKLHECPIGFKYIADLMMEREIAMGGEESGGIGYGRYIPERDGILNSLLLANVMAEESKPLGQLVADLQREFGPHYYGRRDLHIAEEVKQAAIRRARADSTNKLDGFPVLKKETLDGVKFFLDAPTPDHGAEPWVLFRASGTEPLLRVYAEAASPELVNDILARAEHFVRDGSE